MKQAICIPYSAYQNEPSKPIPKIVELSDDYCEMCDQLTNLFFEHVFSKDSIEDEDDQPVVYDGDGKYGDMIVEWNESVFLFVTFIK